MRRMVLVVVIAAVMLGVAAVGLLAVGTADPARADSSANYGWIHKEVVQMTTTGTAGSATGSGSTTEYVRGHIYGIHLEYAAGLPTTTDVTLSGTSPALTVLSVTDSMTDSWYYPAVQEYAAGSLVSSYTRIPMDSQVSVAVAQADEVTTTNALTVTVLWGE